MSPREKYLKSIPFPPFLFFAITLFEALFTQARLHQQPSDCSPRLQPHLYTHDPKMLFNQGFTTDEPRCKIETLRSQGDQVWAELLSQSPLTKSILPSDMQSQCRLRLRILSGCETFSVTGKLARFRANQDKLTLLYSPSSLQIPFSLLPCTLQITIFYLCHVKIGRHRFRSIQILTQRHSIARAA